jgi:hypothetical protein
VAATTPEEAGFRLPVHVDANGIDPVDSGVVAVHVDGSDTDRSTRQREPDTPPKMGGK